MGATQSVPGIEMFWTHFCLCLFFILSTASKEKENKTRNKDFRESAWWPKHHHTPRHRQGSSGKKLMFVYYLGQVLLSKIKRIGTTRIFRFY